MWWEERIFLLFFGYFSQTWNLVGLIVTYIYKHACNIIKLEFLYTEKINELWNERVYKIFEAKNILCYIYHWAHNLMGFHIKAHYFFYFFWKKYTKATCIQFGQRLSYKFFFIELIYMLYIPLDSEFEGLSY